MDIEKIKKAWAIGLSATLKLHSGEIVQISGFANKDRTMVLLSNSLIMDEGTGLEKAEIKGYQKVFL